ncbi:MULTISPECIES: peptidylprolyl isomerase [unclassified Sinorhizobium]|uniref:FKBP-type peptidyl-prolyl cis-trans isomerase n=1 Tax=unclassified Sinorhizobium TaxID=2613772 RepID=UPI0024C2F19A|nr:MULTISPECIES: peptidylprolyl isomerase [unclassified Sinorhizobium]MDK1377355.1 peptidylprolyl isomerase [Sinorhizobium sp. 6-70]MDK1478845.1 peptidylprolyl isomerase [Sinorhizobium sp. 6-117]
MTEVKNGDVVRIHYTAKLADGTAVESSQGREPLEIEVGAGQIIPGLDREISGMTIGETSTVAIPAEQAYGPHDDAQVQTVPRSVVPDGVEIGTRLQATTADGRQLAFTVTSVEDDQVTVDSNHPLAGEDLVFDVTVVEVVNT